MTKSSARKAAADKARSKYRKTTRKVGADKAHGSDRKTASRAVAEGARGTYRKTAAQFEEFAYDAQMPKSMRALAEKSVAQTRELYVHSLEAVLETWEKFVVAFAMDATRPGSLGRRFYIICEADRTFRAIPSGHGDGRNLEGVADFANGIRCAKNFSNAMDSQLTTGGPYVTAEIRTSFKGYYRDPGGNSVALMRSFVQFDGEGDAASARRLTTAS